MGYIVFALLLFLLFAWLAGRILWRGTKALWRWNPPVGRRTVGVGLALLVLFPAGRSLVRTHPSEAYFREVLEQELGVELSAAAHLVARDVEPSDRQRLDDCATAVFEIPPEHWRRLLAQAPPREAPATDACDAPLRDHLYGAPQARGAATANRDRKVRWETYEQSHRLYVEVRRRH